jgi:hypothetical protein
MNSFFNNLKWNLFTQSQISCCGGPLESHHRNRVRKQCWTSGLRKDERTLKHVMDCERHQFKKIWNKMYMCRIKYKRNSSCPIAFVLLLDWWR